jgi:hypothetical protein
VSSSTFSITPPFSHQGEVVFDHEVGEWRLVRPLPLGVERRFRACVRPILEDRFEEAGGQRQPFAPRGGRQTGEFLTDTGDDVFERQRAVAVERPVQG